MVAFCVDSGIHILDRCINEGEGETESAECISDAMDVSFSLQTIVSTVTMLMVQSVAMSPPMAACVCQALHDSFTSLFTTTHLLCSRSLLDSGESFYILYCYCYFSNHIREWFRVLVMCFI